MITLADLDRLEALRVKIADGLADSDDAEEHFDLLLEHEAELIALARQALQPAGRTFEGLVSAQEPSCEMYSAPEFAIVGERRTCAVQWVGWAEGKRVRLQVTLVDDAKEPR